MAVEADRTEVGRVLMAEADVRPMVDLDCQSPIADLAVRIEREVLPSTCLPRWRSDVSEIADAGTAPNDFGELSEGIGHNCSPLRMIAWGER